MEQHQAPEAELAIPSPADRSPRSGRPGFTLIEVMLAVTLLSIIVTVMYSAFHTMGRVMRRNERTKGAYQAARLIMSRMSQDLSCAYFSPKRKNFIFLGEDMEGFNYDADAVTFVTQGHIISGRNAPEGHLAEVSYYLDEDNPGILVRREDVSPDDELEMGGVLQILGRNVEGLNFTYLDGREEAERRRGRNRTGASAETGGDETAEERRAWKDEWDTQETAYLPRAVKIDLSLRNEEGNIEDFSTTVLLAMGRTATSSQPTAQQVTGVPLSPGGTPTRPRGQPTPLGPGAPRMTPRRGQGQQPPGDRPVPRWRRDGSGGRRGTPPAPGSSGTGPRTPSTPTIRRTVPNAGSGIRPPTPGGRR